MFDKFGEFDSAEEINKAAAGLDETELKKLAEENGLDEDDAMDYCGGLIKELATPMTAALGKLKVEKAELALKGVLEDWYDIVVDICMNDKKVMAAVRHKNKSLKVFMSRVLARAFDTKELVSDQIVRITKVKNGKENMRGPVYLGIPNRAEIKKMCRDYYLE